MATVIPFPAQGSDPALVADRAIQALVRDHAGWPLHAVMAGADAASLSALSGADEKEAAAAGRMALLRASTHRLQ